MSRGRAKYYSTKQQQREEVIKAAAERTARNADLKSDEDFKAAHCRTCPHCKRPVEKIEGCDLMVSSPMLYR